MAAGQVRFAHLECGSVSDDPEFDRLLPGQVSRRRFIATGMMPLARIAPEAAAASPQQSDDDTVRSAGETKIVNDFPSYPGALVGFWCSPETRKGDEPKWWEIKVPLGWLSTTITVAFDEKAKLADITATEVLADGKSIGRLSILGQQATASPIVGWLRIGYVAKGDHHFSVSLPAGAETTLVGAWITNGLLSFWPGDPMVLDADSNFWPGGLRLVPRPVSGDMPLEFGRQGLASHINQQGLMGIADSKMTAVPGSLRLRYSDSELNVMLKTDDGPRRVKDVCPDFHFQLLDGFLPCPIAHFTYEQVRYAVTFAAVPEGDEAADLVHVTARNESSEAQPNRVAFFLDTAADVVVREKTLVASSETIACFA